MNPSEDPNDRLLDSLLREQARGKADDELLQAIEAKLGNETPARRRHRHSNAGLWIAAAAAVVVIGLGMVTWRSSRPKAADKLRVMAETRDEAPVPETAPETGQPVAHRSQERLIWEGDESAAASIEAGPAEGTVLPGDRRVETGGDVVMPEELAGLSRGAGKDAIFPRPPRQRVLPPAPGSDSVDPFGGASGLPAEEAPAGLAGGTASGSGSGTGPARSKGSAPVPAKGRLLGRDAAAEGWVNRSAGTLLPVPLPERGQRFPVPGGNVNRENYGRLIDQPWKSPWQDALSTFSIDVDTASYTNVRRMILEGRPVPADAVRIEELVNYFDYGYEGPQGDGPFAVHGTLATCPWKPQHLLARVAIKGREIDAKARPASNLVFLIDVSGSMQDPVKLPLLKRSMRVLLGQLDERDRLGIVVYAGSEGVVLEPTTLDERGLSAAIQTLEKLEAGGSTNGGAGIKRAYEMAARHLVPGGVNRVILATDGDFNVGTTGQGELVSLVKQGAAKGVSLSVVGFGTGNLNDAMLEAITNDGNGNYFYIDGDHEARRVFLQKLTGTLVTIAKDVKIQVEFNPGKVQAYRLVGYANRILRHEDFNNDKVDAGDIGAGHTVTAFYEVVPPGVAMPDTGKVDGLRFQKPAEKEPVPSDDWLTLKLRYKHPEGEVSNLIETPLKGEPQPWEQAGGDFRFASAVALFGMKLRQMPELADVSWQKVVEIARLAVAGDAQEQRSEFVEMVARHGRFPLPPIAVQEQADALDGLSYLKHESTMWYVQFGLESGGKWAPRFIGLTPDRKTKLQNRVSAVEMLSPGDEFFKEGAFAGRFKFLGIEVREVTNERTGLTEWVKVAFYEELKPNKKGARYESRAGLPDAELESKAYHDRTAVIAVGGKEIRVEEGTRFTGTEGRDFLLKSVAADRIEVEYKGADGKSVTRVLRK